MHIETLKVFCDLAETGSFSFGGAEKKSSRNLLVSEHSRSVEDRYGGREFDRAF